MLGLRLEHDQRSRPLGRRVAQYVEADQPAGPVVSRRQPPSFPALFAVSRAANEGPDGIHSDAGVRKPVQFGWTSLEAIAMDYDLVLTGGRVIDCSQSIDRVTDVAF